MAARSDGYLWISVVLLFAIVSLVILLYPKAVKSASDHVLINEVQVTGASADDEFVELFNPTGSVVDLAGWRLTRKTAGGSQSNLISSMSGSIAPGGHLLIAHPGYDGIVLPDIAYSATSSGIAINNTVLLYSDAGTTIVDKVGMGTASDFESVAIANPATDGSISRLTDTDTGNNSVDFIVNIVSGPQNSLSTTPSTPSGTGGQATPTPSGSPSPTAAATASASPTPSTPSGTGGQATPTSTPEPSPTSSPTPNPTAAPTSTPRGRALGRMGFGVNARICFLRYHRTHIGFFSFRIPRFACE